MHNELQRMGKEEVVAQSEEMFRYLRDGTDESHKICGAKSDTRT